MKRIVSGVLIIAIILLVGLVILVVTLPEEEPNKTLNGVSYETLDTLQGPYPTCPYYDDCTYDGTRKYKNRQQ